VQCTAVYSVRPTVKEKSNLILDNIQRILTLKVFANGGNEIKISPIYSAVQCSAVYCMQCSADQLEELLLVRGAELSSLPSLPEHTSQHTAHCTRLHNALHNALHRPLSTLH
jgi:hypothetical protein